LHHIIQKAITNSPRGVYCAKSGIWLFRPFAVSPSGWFAPWLVRPR